MVVPIFVSSIKNWIGNFLQKDLKTLNGLILEYLEDIPEANISLRIAGYPIEVLEMRDNMVKTVRVIPDFIGMRKLTHRIN